MLNNRFQFLILNFQLFFSLPKTLISATKKYNKFLQRHAATDESDELKSSASQTLDSAEISLSSDAKTFSEASELSDSEEISETESKSDSRWL